MTVYGQIVDGAEVEAALLAHLRAWMPAYVAEVKRQKDPDDEIWPPSAGRPLGLEPINSYTVVHEANEKWPENHLPMLLAYCPGLGEPPMAEGDGTYSGRFQVILTAIASGIDLADTKALARLYASAARAAILQHPALGGFAAEDGIDWVGHENYRITKGVEAERNLMGVSDTFLIGVAQILNRDAGPRQPFVSPTDPPDDPLAVPDEHPVVAEGGGSAVVEQLTAHGFFNNEED